MTKNRPKLTWKKNKKRRVTGKILWFSPSLQRVGTVNGERARGGLASETARYRDQMSKAEA